MEGYVPMQRAECAFVSSPGPRKASKSGLTNSYRWTKAKAYLSAVAKHRDPASSVPRVQNQYKQRALLFGPTSVWSAAASFDQSRE